MNKVILFSILALLSSCMGDINNISSVPTEDFEAKDKIIEINTESNNTSDSSSTSSSIVQNATTFSTSSLTTSSTASSIAQTITGSVKYQRAPVDDEGKLDFDNMIYEPVRHAKIKAFIPTSNTLLDESELDENGTYLLTITQETTVRLIIYAESEEYQLSVVNNSNNNKLYEYRSYAFNPFYLNEFDIHIASGWAGDKTSGGYRNEKQAAPFAVLDTLITGCKKLRENHIKLSIKEEDYCSEDLTVNWSSSNSSSSFNTVDNELYIASVNDVNTDEYDQHVILAEFMKYILSNYSRNDSIGGIHYKQMTLAPEQAFTEGFSQAMAGIFLEDKMYADTAGTRSQSPLLYFSLEYETFQVIEDEDLMVQSAFNELTVREFIWDLWDDNNTGYDKSTIDLEKILLAIKSKDFTQGHALATIYSFANNFIEHYRYYEKDVKDLLSFKGIVLENEYGDNETNTVNGTADNRLYRSILVDAPALTLNFGGSDYFYNEDLNVKRVRFTTDAGSDIGQYRVIVNSGAVDTVVEVFDNGAYNLSSDANPSSAKVLHTYDICDTDLDNEDEYIIRIYQSPLSSASAFSADVSVQKVEDTSVDFDCP